MTIADDRPSARPPGAPTSDAPTPDGLTPGALAPLPPWTGDERASRTTLRAQIARLEARLAAETPLGRVAAARRPAVVEGPRLLDLGELERVRDDLAARLEIARRTTAARDRARAEKRALRSAMLADPDAHRGVTVTSDDLGEPGCIRWSVRPVLGPLGRLAGWWRVRISSGCP
jgi:hypothetical protein